MVEPTMDVTSWLHKRLEQASPDLLRAMVQDFAEALMGAEADALCGAGYGERSPERVNIRNGYRERPHDGNELVVGVVPHSSSLSPECCCKRVRHARVDVLSLDTSF